MKRDDFINLYYTHNVTELPEILNCSLTTIYKRIKEYGIEKKGQTEGHKQYRKLDLE